MITESNEQYTSDVHKDRKTEGAYGRWIKNYVTVNIHMQQQQDFHRRAIPNNSQNQNKIFIEIREDSPSFQLCSIT